MRYMGRQSRFGQGRSRRGRRALGWICCFALALLICNPGSERGAVDSVRHGPVNFITSIDSGQQRTGPRDANMQGRCQTVGVLRPKLFCGAYVPPLQGTFEESSRQYGFSQIFPATAFIAAAAGSTAIAVQYRTPVARLCAWLLKSGGPWVLVVCAVLQKCAADALTWWTRSGGTAYSGSSVTLVSEILKFPVIAVAVAVSESPSRVGPVFKSILATDWRIMLIGSAYAAQNLLYFACLSHISPVGYQVLGQTKVFFTAMLMWLMMNRSFSGFQIAALFLLFIGTVCTQLEEASLAALLGSKGNVAIGCALTALSSLLSALPNVWYESILKEKNQTSNSQWESNIQLNVSSLLWVVLLTLVSPVGGFDVFKGGNSVSTVLSTLWSGFTPAVWVIVILKTLNCVIVPCCLKYADNIMYNFAKPLSICLSCAGLALYTSTWPSARMLAAICLVILSMQLYRIKK